MSFPALISFGSFTGARAIHAQHRCATYFPDKKNLPLAFRNPIQKEYGKKKKKLKKKRKKKTRGKRFFIKTGGKKKQTNSCNNTGG